MILGLDYHSTTQSSEAAAIFTLFSSHLFLSFFCFLCLKVFVSQLWFHNAFTSNYVSISSQILCQSIVASFSFHLYTLLNANTLEYQFNNKHYKQHLTQHLFCFARFYTMSRGPQCITGMMGADLHSGCWEKWDWQVCSNHSGIIFHNISMSGPWIPAEQCVFHSMTMGASRTSTLEIDTGDFRSGLNPLPQQKSYLVPVP